MKVAVFSTKPYDRRFLDAANARAGHDLTYFDAPLSSATTSLAHGSKAVCVFVNDRVDREAMTSLAAAGVELIALRSAGFNNVCLASARERGVRVARVPSYSPEAVAEHSVALILALNRNIHRAYNRVREGNFSLDGLLGFNLSGQTIGIIGTGQIGLAVARIMRGFGCGLLGFDPAPNAEFEQLGGGYVEFSELLARSRIVTLHCPLTTSSRHLIDSAAIAAMQPGTMLINTSRGAVVDTKAVIAGLKSGRIGQLGLDVYEEEGGLFFDDRSGSMIQDDVFARLLTFPNVLVTGHQGFFTHEALAKIAEVTIGNITSFERTGRALHEVSLPIAGQSARYAVNGPA